MAVNASMACSSTRSRSSAACSAPPPPPLLSMAGRQLALTLPAAGTGLVQATTGLYSGHDTGRGDSVSVVVVVVVGHVVFGVSTAVSCSRTSHSFNVARLLAVDAFIAALDTKSIFTCRHVHSRGDRTNARV